jgi:hypothetical protein
MFGFLSVCPPQHCETLPLPTVLLNIRINPSRVFLCAYVYCLVFELSPPAAAVAVSDVPASSNIAYWIRLQFHA